MSWTMLETVGDKFETLMTTCHQNISSPTTYGHLRYRNGKNFWNGLNDAACIWPNTPKLIILNLRLCLRSWIWPSVFVSINHSKLSKWFFIRVIFNEISREKIKKSEISTGKRRTVFSIFESFESAGRWSRKNNSTQNIWLYILLSKLFQCTFQTIFDLRKRTFSTRNGSVHDLYTINYSD